MDFDTIKEKVINLKYLNHWIIFASDLFFSVVATVITVFLLELTLGLQIDSTLYLRVALFAGVASGIGLYVVKPYKGVIRHSTFFEAGLLGGTILIKDVLLVPAVYFLTDFKELNILVLGGFLDFFVSTFTLIFVRVLMIIVYRSILNSVRRTSDREKDNMLVVDSESSQSSMTAASFSHLEENFRVIGIISREKKQLRVNGYSIFSVTSEEEFDKLVKKYFIKAVLFPGYRAVKRETDRIVKYCQKRGLRMLILPAVDEMKEGKINFKNLPEVRIEDLLQREEIKIDMEGIAATLKGKTVMVTGAAGSIGSEMCRQLSSFGLKDLLLVDNAETPMHNIHLELRDAYPNMKYIPILADVREEDSMELIFNRHRPDMVFHAAAYKHVPLMEDNPCEAIRTNVRGTMIMANLAVAYNVEKFVMISTDKAVNPTNVMGASKRLAEMYVQSLGVAVSKGEHPGITRFITTRFGNVLGSNGSVIPRFREQLAKGGPITVTHPDIIRYFMTIPEACRLVLEAANMGEGNEIFVFDMGKPVKIVDLAKSMIRLAGMVPNRDIKIEFTGLRPGEKLYEELLLNKENTIPTGNEKIFRAQVIEQDYATVTMQISELCHTARLLDRMETVRQMKQIVPEFISNSSTYEILDKEKLLNGNNAVNKPLKIDEVIEIAKKTAIFPDLR